MFPVNKSCEFVQVVREPAGRRERKRARAPSNLKVHQMLAPPQSISSFFSGLTLQKKILMVGVGFPAIIIAVLLVMYASEAKQNAVDASVDKARSICLSAESAREQTEKQWGSGIFSHEVLRDWGEKNEDDKILSTVPVVTAWETAMAKAEQGGYEFHVPALEPRNPKNTATPLQREALLKLQDENLDEYFVVNKETNAVHYFRPVRLGESCLNCHGDPALAQDLWNNPDGTDVTGYKMENWDVGHMHGAFEVVQSLDKASAAVTKSIFVAIGIALACLLVAALLTMTTLKSVLSRVKLATHTISDYVVGLIGASDQLQSDSADASSRTASMSDSVRGMAENVSSVSQAMEQIGSSIAEIATQSSHASETADSGVAEVSKTIEVMKRLGDSSSRVDEVTKVINSLAEQTNLLALNATIEAARAGESGRGFAVVASEVKELANQTSQATDGIMTVIGSIRDDTVQAIKSVEQIHGVIRDIHEGQHSVASAVEEQRVMTEEIARNIREVSQSGDDMRHQLASVSESSHATTTQVEKSARLIQEIDKVASDLPAMIGLATDNAAGETNRANDASARTTAPFETQIPSQVRGPAA